MRLFIASSFPPEVIGDLNDRVTRLKPRLPAASWVRPEAQHVTYAFLGEQQGSIIDKIDEPLRAALAKLAPFEANLLACGFFPNNRHARVGWAGLEPESKFVDVANVVRDVVTKQGVALDGGDFKPHLTLLRVRDPWPPASIELFCKSLKDYKSATFTVDSIILYSSQLSPKGAIHTPQGTYPLAS
ncbi:MAG TPA: RNA 2',3'-cyclic phosphodiesterase [Thermoanaerobaculia bacterium]|nr:RNA 2',3'-cyclic phosphodiesterase [Thermoanaerobaculia bacterium]